MAKNIIIKITEKAERLKELRNQITKIEEENKIALEVYKRERDELQESLLSDLNKNDLKSINTTDGVRFSRAIRRGVDVTDMISALRWAKENNAVTIDKTIAAQKLKDVDELPAGFELKETEYISITNPKTKS